MTIDIAKTIREVLDDRDTVTLLGLGTLSLKHNPAFVKDSGQILSPPTMHLEITEAIDTNRSLLKKLVSNHKISKDKAKEVVKNFSNRILNALVNYNKVLIPGVGLIKKDGEGNYTIDQKSSFASAYYLGYPELNIVPLSKVSEPEQKGVEELDITEEVKPVSENQAPLQKSSSVEETRSSQAVEVEEPKTLNDILKTKVADTPKKTASLSTTKIVSKEVKENKITSPPPVLNYQEEKRRDWLWPILWLIGLCLLLLFCFKACNYLWYYGDDDSGRTNEINASDLLGEGGNQDVNDSLKAAINNIEGDKSLIPASGKCKIITGVYQKSSNALRRKNVVNQKGYEAYTEQFGPYTRVGLIFDCDENTNLSEYLLNVRREIDPYSWYLDPTLYVDYE